MHFVYIIYSKELDRFYVGESASVIERVQQHNSHFFAKSFTSNASDWELKLSMEFPNRISARNAECFIKKMKSRQFIERLIEDHSWIIEKFR